MDTTTTTTTIIMITGMGIITGAMLQVYNMWMTARSPAAVRPLPVTAA